VNEHVFKLFIAKVFAKVFQNEFTVYAFIMCNIVKELTVEHQVKALNNEMSYIINTFKTQILFIELKEYKDVFSIENVNKLSLHEKHDHAIEITAESSYDLLYNLLNTELVTLRQYVNDVLIKE
jgi:3-isopropylmalate dehydratase small subunit